MTLARKVRPAHKVTPDLKVQPVKTVSEVLRVTLGLLALMVNRVRRLRFRLEP